MKKRRIACAAILSVALVSGLNSGLVITIPQAHAAATVEMQRLYNPNSGEHFYTASTFERDHLVDVGWNHEGVGWVAPETSATPVYRLYNANAGDHHYTTSVVERDHLISVGWNDEGIGWYSDDAQGVPLHRQYNPNAVAGSHNYTTSEVERDHLISVGWNDEGIAWYGVDMNANQATPDNPSTPSNPSTPDNPDSPNTPTNPDTPTPPSSEQAIANVKQYSYKIAPVNGKLNEYFFVETDNPDPASFQFVDSQSKYVDDAGSAHIRPELRTFGDVVYTNADTYRIANKGYLFRDESGKTDGGSLDLVAIASDNVYGYTYDTGITVSCPDVEDDVDYLIRTYASGVTAFFDKLDAIDKALTSLALYPKFVLDTDKPSTDGYPCLAASPYAEVGLNDHIENMYQGGGSLLINTVYGFVLDSAGFPGMERSVAKRLQPDCTFSGGLGHAYFNVTYNGETRAYGGAGQGTTNPLYTKFVEKTFRFDGADNGFGTNFSMDAVKEKRLEYAAKSDAFANELMAKISNSEVSKVVGDGAWIRIAREGYSSSTTRTYAYAFYAGQNNIQYASDAWVDGRYVNANESYEAGAKFSDHPTANIILHDITYKDDSGVTRTTTVNFHYNAAEDCWETWHFAYSPSDRITLSRAQVNVMVASGQIDGNTSAPPPAKYIYDGTAEPGTPCG